MSQLSQKKQDYIEEFSMLMEGFGLPRMAGRVFAALLVADPPEQSSEDLAEQLQASRGGISGAVQLLETMGFIERTRKLGERKDFFRNKPNAWYEAMKREIMMLTQLTSLIEKGLEVVDSDEPEVTRGLRDMQELMLFFEKRIPLMFAEWEEDRAKGQS